MTEFQLGLLAIGALVVAGVFAYNHFQERSARRAAERAFGPSARDALLDAPATRRSEATPAEARPPAVRAPAPPAATLPDARIDYVVQLAFGEPCPAGRLLDLWKEYEHRYAKRALLAVSPDGTQWFRLAPDAPAARALQAGLQLVSREGAVGDAELIEFRAAIDSIAAATGASIAASELRQAVEHAHELDGFCAEADIQIVFHLVPQPGGAFDEIALAGAAEEAGLELEADGRFALRAADEHERFSLAWRDGPGDGAGLSLTFDVPRAPGGRASFQAMARFARELAAALGGSLVDDNGQVLDERALAAIEAQLAAVHAAFAQKGIEPGSAVAQRLFS